MKQRDDDVLVFAGRHVDVYRRKDGTRYEVKVERKRKPKRKEGRP